MRYRSLTVETAPAIEPVTLAEAKQHLRVDIADDDTYIEALIVAARQYAEEYLDRALISQQLAMRMDTFPYEFELPRPPMATSGTLTTTAVTLRSRSWLSVHGRADDDDALNVTVPR
jgi:hypothetical protein